jgi:NADPH-dependent glutamate synthase beta subunit-like oxidoreductase
MKASGESRYCPKCEKNETRNECSYGVKYEFSFLLSEAKVKRWWDDDGDGIGYEEGEVKKSKKKKTRKEEYSNWRESLDEDWQKVNKGDKTDGMSPAAVKAYRRENPGSKLKTAVIGDPKPGSKDAKRRKSFCARSKGQQDMHNIDCSSTPDKPVCKARRRWKC